METTHFKAPWKLCYDGQIDSADGRTVARFQWESYREFTELSGDEQKTLRLIAAAPDLLAALIAARTSAEANRDALYEGHYQPHTGDVDAKGRLAVDAEDALLSWIDATIAKATGAI